MKMTLGILLALFLVGCQTPQQARQNPYTALQEAAEKLSNLEATQIEADLAIKSFFDPVDTSWAGLLEDNKAQLWVDNNDLDKPIDIFIEGNRVLIPTTNGWNESQAKNSPFGLNTSIFHKDLNQLISLSNALSWQSEQGNIVEGRISLGDSEFFLPLEIYDVTESFDSNAEMKIFYTLDENNNLLNIKIISNLSRLSIEFTVSVAEAELENIDIPQNIVDSGFDLTASQIVARAQRSHQEVTSWATTLNLLSSTLSSAEETSRLLFIDTKVDGADFAVDYRYEIRASGERTLIDVSWIGVDGIVYSRQEVDKPWVIINDYSPTRTTKFGITTTRKPSLDHILSAVRSATRQEEDLEGATYSIEGTLTAAQFVRYLGGEDAAIGQDDLPEVLNISLTIDSQTFLIQQIIISGRNNFLSTQIIMNFERFNTNMEFTAPL